MSAMVIDMNETRLCTLGQIQAFLEGTGEVGFQPMGGDEGPCGHLQAVLKRFAYPGLKRADKGLVLRYLGRATGYSRQQVTAWCGNAWPQEDWPSTTARRHTALSASTRPPMWRFWRRLTPCTIPSQGPRLSI